MVSLSTPGSVGNHLFDRWTIDGVDHHTRTPTFLAIGNHTAVAHYQLPSTLTITATLDGVANGPTIQCSPNDLGNQSSVMAPGTLSYRPGQNIELTRPASLDGVAVFRRWTIDGVPHSSTGQVSRAHGYQVTTRFVAEYESVPCFESDLGTALQMGDETLVTGLDLGFDFPLPGGGTTRTVDVCDNGYIWLLSGNAGNLVENEPGDLWLIQGPPRVCPFWFDMSFQGAGGDVYFNTSGGRAVITWNRAVEANVQHGPLPGRFTVQCQLTADGLMRFSYSGAFPTAGRALIGWSPGNGATAPSFTDFSGTFGQRKPNRRPTRCSSRGSGPSMSPTRSSSQNPTVKVAIEAT